MLGARHEPKEHRLEKVWSRTTVPPIGQENESEELRKLANLLIVVFGRITLDDEKVNDELNRNNC